VVPGPEELAARRPIGSFRGKRPVDGGRYLTASLSVRANVSKPGERRLPPKASPPSAGRHAVETVLWPALLRLNARYPDIKVEVSIEPALIDIVTEQYDAGVRQGERIARDMIALRIGT
jgi:DNA-binding transcriptional LysR family regulator